MSKLQKNLTLWAAFLSLVFAFSLSPALAQTASPTPQASPKSKKSKKEKSTDAQTGQSSTGAAASDSGTSKKSTKEKTSETSPEATKPSAATKTETSSSDTGTAKKSKKSTKSEETSSAGASTPTKTAESSKPVESKPLPQTDKPAGGGKTETGGASAGEIASAQASGKVWVNLDSGIYHKGGQYYGHTKNGKFMTEAEAQKAGYREAKK